MLDPVVDAVVERGRILRACGCIAGSCCGEGGREVGDVGGESCEVGFESASWAVNSVTRAAVIRYNDPYGNPRDGSAATPWPAGQRGFVGGVADPTGLTLLGARFYDPRTGAFISVDPEVDEYDPQRLHPFAYANNNPVTFADPDGLFWGAIKNGMQKAAGSVASGVTSAAKSVVNNAGTIAAVAGTVAMVTAVLPPPAPVIAAAAGAVSAVAGAIDTAKSCVSGSAGDCAVGVAGMVPGVRQAKTAARGVGAAKNVVKKAAADCNSFVPGTRVLMADGSHKPIEEIDLDDEVQAADPETGKDGSRPVTRLITGQGDKDLVDIAVEGSTEKLTATAGHPFWVENEKKWIQAGQLRPGMVLLTPDGARVTVIAIVAYGAVATVHNLTVDDIHTYFVEVGGRDVLVHNISSCPISTHEIYLLDFGRHGHYVGRTKNGLVGRYGPIPWRIHKGRIIHARSHSILETVRGCNCRARRQEQIHINNQRKAGLTLLNKRNEIARSRWRSFGI